MSSAQLGTAHGFEHPFDERVPSGLKFTLRVVGSVEFSLHVAPKSSDWYSLTVLLVIARILLPSEDSVTVRQDRLPAPASSLHEVPEFVEIYILPGELSAATTTLPS